ncbi:MBL fold metallo-hydrolase [Patescibacteria group bacterium]|nr:MBL fold metallo-hydrolase [Patescibacteria group bacterium]MBU1728244.1 MBL fold metallo-hydrolase [Patescibacteria group bacterium]
MEEMAKITFCGGAGSVTGANFLFEVYGKKILVDCGLTQGSKLADDINWDPFSYNPKEIDILFVTHSHIDHIGRIPKLIHDGFRGKIYSTFPTKALIDPMLKDTAGILSKNKEFSLHEIYSDNNIKLALSLWQGFEYHEKIKITENLEASFLNAGHILGSAMVEFIFNKKKFVFTGDLGNSPSPILPDCERITDADYLIMESTYGDRNHESRNDRKNMLEDAIEENVKKKGTLMIPTFSLERTQELLFEINDLIERGSIPLVPFFLDSPLAIKLTDIYKKFESYLNDEAKKLIESGKDVFVFPGLRPTLEAEQSRTILRMPNPKIIIAGSGMSSGGRIVHHEKQYLPDPNNMLLLTGYQSVGTPGRLIQEGDKTVRIYGEDVTVRAKVITIHGYSGHKDSDNLLSFVEDTQETLRKVFVVMGEPKSSMFLAQKIRDNLGVETSVPELGESISLPC